MATAIAAIRPQTGIQITNRRLTCAGIQYTIQDRAQVHITTFTPFGQFQFCTCGYERYSIECAHRRLAQAQEQAYQLEAEQRAAYIVACSIY